MSMVAFLYKNLDYKPIYTYIYIFIKLEEVSFIYNIMFVFFRNMNAS